MIDKNNKNFYQPSTIKRRRRTNQQSDFTVEVEAMPAHILRGILRKEIKSLLPSGALAAVKVAEESERNGLIILANEAGGEK